MQQNTSRKNGSSTCQENIENKVSWTSCSQRPTTRPCPKPEEFTPRFPILFLESPFYITYPSTPRSYEWSLSFMFSPVNIFTYLCFFTIPKSHLSHHSYLLIFTQGHLKWVGAQLKKISGPRSKTDGLKFFTRVLYWWVKKNLVCPTLTVSCRLTWAGSKMILRRKTKMYET